MDFSSLRQECVNSGSLYEDPDFPAINENIFYHNIPDSKFEWKRPQELTKDPKFVIDSRSQYDVICGKYGNQNLVSALGVLYQYRGLFYRAVPADQGFSKDYSYAGIFHFRLWWCGEWTEVIVDDRLPCIDGNVAFIQAEKSNQFWAALLEKAYAKLHGSYEVLKYASSIDILNELTGGTTERLALQQANDDPIQRLLEDSAKQTTILTCVLSSERNRGAGRHLSVNNIFPTTSSDVGMLLKICSPPDLAEQVSITEFDQTDPEWQKLTQKERDVIQSQSLLPGETWISWKSLRSDFERLEIVFLDADTCQSEQHFKQSSKNQKLQSPHTRIFSGFWKKGITAGGCRNNIETFHVNPQVLLGVSKNSDVLIALIQHHIQDARVIGFSVYKLPGGGITTNQLMKASFFRTTKAIHHSNYSNSRQVFSRLDLEAGNYVIIPSTYEPGFEGIFTMRVYSLVPITLGFLDTIPLQTKPIIVKAVAGNEDYRNIFVSCADEKKTCNAFELQEVLHSALPNDYMKIDSLDICRKIIQALNPNHRLGRINYNQFIYFMYSLKVWQGIFDHHNKGASGALKAEQLRDVLSDVGFQLSIDLMHLLLLRYMRRDGTLRFGDTVSAILHLIAAFNIFQRKANEKSDMIELNSKDWMKSVLRC